MPRRSAFLEGSQWPIAAQGAGSGEELGSSAPSNQEFQGQTLTLGDGGGGVRRVRQLVGWQCGHASGWETSRQKVVEGSQLVSSCLLAPAGTTVTEPDLKERGC